jgi:flagellar assembly protein FliH
LYNKIFKSDEVSVGGPVQIKIPVNFETIEGAYKPDAKFADENLEQDVTEIEETNSGNYEDIIERAKMQSEELIKAAEIQAQRIIEDAEAEAGERLKALEEEARQQGFDKGYEEAKNMYQHLLTEAEHIKEHAKLEYSKVMETIEKDAIDLIIDIARRVIGEEITLNKEHLVNIVGEALGKSSNRDNILVRVSAQDYDYVLENKDKLLSVAEGIGELDIKKDVALKPGDCLIETSYGSIDAGVDTKLKNIEEAFLKIVPKG